jgi:PIN domain nuclease of toxin-antitoxin system
MKYLLDTAVWLWSLQSPELIADEGRQILERGEEEIYLSAVTSWEISIKMRVGKLNFAGPPAHDVPRFMAKQNLRPLSIAHSHAAKVYDLPAHHKDPFDRMLIAQALIEDMVILTSDRSFRKYHAKLVWCGNYPFAGFSGQ